MSNKAIGNGFESVIIGYLSKKGYWVHLLKDNQNGQPFDIIALGGDKVLCLDAKHCETKKFPLSNVRENQELAFDYISSIYNGNSEIGFVIGSDKDNLHLLTFDEYKKLKANKKKSVVIEELPLL